MGQGIANRLGELEDKMAFLLQVVMLQVQLGHPLDPSSQQTQLWPASKLYEEVQRAKNMVVSVAEEVPGLERLAGAIDDATGAGDEPSDAAFLDGEYAEESSVTGSTPAARRIGTGNPGTAPEPPAPRLFT